MRSPVMLVAVVALLACSSRTLDYPPVDYTEEIESICNDLCGMGEECNHPPIMEYEDCLSVCNGPGEMHEDSECGEAFRAWFGCIGSTETCEEYLDTRNAHAEEYTCKEETLIIVDLMCGAREGSD